MTLPQKFGAKLSRPATEDQTMNPPRRTVRPPSVRHQSEQAFAAALDELQATFDDGDVFGDVLFGDAAIGALNLTDAPESPTAADDIAPAPLTQTQAMHRSLRI
jgi:hypothetical protein